MPVRSRKQQSVAARVVYPLKGIDLSKPSSAIHDNALTRAHNFWYEPSYQGIVTRMGTQSINANTLPGVITNLHYHVLVGGTGYLVAATNDLVQGKALWALIENAGENQWLNITELENEPSLMSFDGVLLIADGRNGGLVAWDGMTVNEIQGSPPRPTVLAIISDRVVSNSLDALDAVFFSEPEQYDAWSVSSGGAALIIPAGFGEGMQINGLTALYGILVVSKVSKDTSGMITQKRLHMINTQGTPESWSGVQLSASNSTSVRNAITSVADKVFFLDSDGIQSVSPSTGGAYGDISIDPETGIRIQALIGQQARRATSADVKWIKYLGQLWFIIRAGGSSTIVIYHPLHGGAWTEVSYPFTPRCLCEALGNVYIAADNGKVYKFIPIGEDDGVKTQTLLRTKKFDNIGGDVILRGVKLNIGRLQPAKVRVEAVGDDEVTRYGVANFETESVGSSEDYIYDANHHIYDANWPIFGGRGPVASLLDWRVAGPRDPAMSIQIRTNGGRITIDSIQAVIANVGQRYGGK